MKQQGIRADFYHAGLSHDERNERQQKWIENNTTVMVCTNAFGMGIDKPDARLVIHTGIPDSIENYYQEAGRAGRDGKPSKAILLYDNKESASLRASVFVRFADYATLKKLYIDLMNHLQVAAGSGEGSAFDFELNTFITHFKWNMLQATYGLQTLAQEELFFMSEGIFRGSRLGFTAGKEQIYEFEKMYPTAEPIIKGLLRCYEGIYDRMVPIQETRIAKFISTPIEIVRQQLSFLHQHNIIQYEPASDKPRIVLLRNRMYADDFRLDLKNHETRKQKYSERIEAMLTFVFDKETCRSKLIGHYFNDKQINDCGVCDNCRRKHLSVLSTTLFKEISNHLYVLLTEKPISFSEIQQKSSIYNKEHLHEVVTFLTESKKIESDRWGNLRWV